MTKKDRCEGIIRDGVREGLSCDELAETSGASPESIRAWCKIWKITPARKTSVTKKDECETQIQELVSLGKTAEEISAATGACTGSIRAWCKSWGLAAPWSHRVWATPKSLQHFWDAVANIGGPGCWPWTEKCDLAGYGLFGEGKRVTCSGGRAHRFSWAIANVVPVPEGKFILHSCDNPPCVNPEHLRPGTHQENMDDMKRRCRQKTIRGTGAPHAKLDDCLAMEIWNLRDKTPRNLVALQFGISERSVYSIWKKETWAHIHRP